MTAAQGTPNMGEREKMNKFNKFRHFLDFFPQALLCGFSKLQLQTQATAQVGKSHSGRLRVWRILFAKGQFLTVFTAFGDTYP